MNSDLPKVLHAVGAWREVSCIARTAQRAFLLADSLGLETLAIVALASVSQARPVLTVFACDPDVTTVETVPVSVSVVELCVAAARKTPVSAHSASSCCIVPGFGSTRKRTW